MKSITHKIIAIFLAVFTIGVQTGFSMSVMGCLHDASPAVQQMSCCHENMEISSCAAMGDMDCCIDEQVFVQYDFLSAGVSKGKDLLETPVFDVLSSSLQHMERSSTPFRDGLALQSKTLLQVESLQVLYQVFRL